MKRQTPVQTQKETMPPQMRGLLPHAAVRMTSEHDMPSNGSAETRFGHDFSKVTVWPSVPIVSQDYSNASCPLFPQRCPFGGVCHTCPPQVQAKLKVGQPGDKYEQEADRVADQVMRMPEPEFNERASVTEKAQVTHLQRECSKCDEELRMQPCEECEEKIQRQPLEEEEEELQMKQGEGHTPTVTPKTQNHIGNLIGGGQPLSPAVRSFFEPRFGYDFSQVRVHADSRAAEAAQMVNARAFTLNDNIVFNRGEYQPHTQRSRRLLAHELVHVFQKNPTGRSDTIQRVCSPPQRRVNTDPNEGQSPGASQLPSNPCIWVLYGFTIGGSVFSASFTPVINQLYVFLHNNARARIELLGLNDCFGSTRMNIRIGNARAQSVKNAFPSDVHSQITMTQSTGTRFLVPNNTALNRAINRSVQIRLIPPSGVPCPRQQPLTSQLTPRQAGMCSTTNFSLLENAAKLALPTVITALARVRNWRNNANTRSLIDVYYATGNNIERQAAVNQVIRYLERIIPFLQSPLVDCMEPGHWAYSRICPSSTIADSGGPTVVRIPTFCFPQFSNLISTTMQAMTVLHEMSHNPAGSSDYRAYYTMDCLPTTATSSLSRPQRLTHADSFACFVTVLANR